MWRMRVSLFCRLALSIMNLVGLDSASSVALTFPPPPTHKPLPGSVLASSKDMGLVTLRSVSA